MQDRFPSQSLLFSSNCSSVNAFWSSWHFLPDQQSVLCACFQYFSTEEALLKLLFFFLAVISCEFSKKTCVSCSLFLHIQTASEL